MTVDDLKTHLESQFDLVCFCDISDAVSSHGEIFKIFKNNYQKEFASNQRLVFYTATAPSQLVLDHIQRAATKIDISNYFIMICSPCDLTSQLLAANKKYGNDDVTIQHYHYLLSHTKPINSDKIYPFDTFCAAPFGMLHVSQDITVNPCCKYQEKTGLFDHNSFFSEKMTQLREDIKHRRRHENCKICWDVEDHGGTSLRQHIINKYAEPCEQEWIDNICLRDLTISPVILCNFKCRICSPEISSSIAAEEIKFSTDPARLQQLKTILKYSTDNNQKTADKILQVASDLSNLHILGGEPFLWQDLDYLLENLIDAGAAKNIQIEFNTNGSKFSADTVDKLLKFKSVEILISMDDIGERFELQRGGTWQQILTNIESFKQLQSPTFAIKIAPTVNIQNLLYLDQLVDFCLSHNLEIVWWYLESPELFSIDRVTQTTKNLVYQKYSNHANDELRSIAKRVVRGAPVSGSMFLEYMKKLDQRRGQDSSIILKEIFDAMSR